MNKINYDSLMQREISTNTQKKRLLLHSCCAPCSSACLERVKDDFFITVFYYNPNIDGKEEYEKRANEQIRLLNETGWGDFVVMPHDEERFFQIAQGLESAKEGGARCYKCYYLRMEESAKYAKEHGFDYFCTTLTLSPLKNCEWLNKIGFELQEKYNVKYLPSDFKKRGGYLRSIELSKEHSLYRQNFCGCRFSKREETEK